MRQIILAILMLAFSTGVNAAEGRRTAAVGGFVVGAVTGFLVRDAMEVKPAPQVVYVESQPRVIYVERPQVIYYDEQRRPIVTYVSSEPSTVYVEINGRISAYHRQEVRPWTPPIAHPFPQ